MSDRRAERLKKGTNHARAQIIVLVKKLIKLVKNVTKTESEGVFCFSNYMRLNHQKLTKIPKAPPPCSPEEPHKTFLKNLMISYAITAFLVLFNIGCFNVAVYANLA
jgi:hypothetical protein